METNDGMMVSGCIHWMRNGGTTGELQILQSVQAISIQKRNNLVEYKVECHEKLVFLPVTLA